MLSYRTASAATHNIAPYIRSHRSEGITLKKPTSGAMTETLKDKASHELRFNVLLAHSTNFQHTSLLKCSLKLKLHQLKAYKPLYRCSSTVKAQLLKSHFLFHWTSLHAPAMGQRSDLEPGEPQLYLPGIKMTVIIRFSIVIPVLAESLPRRTHLPRRR